MMASYKAALSAAILLTKKDDAILCVALGSGSFLNVVAVLVDVCVCVCVFVCFCVFVFLGATACSTHTCCTAGLQVRGVLQWWVLLLVMRVLRTWPQALHYKEEVIPMQNSDGYRHFNYLES